MWEVMTECDKCHPGVTPRDTVMMSHSPAPAPRRGFRAALDPINIMRWQKEENYISNPCPNLFMGNVMRIR